MKDILSDLLGHLSIKLIFLLGSILLTTACSQNSRSPNDVMQAYNSPGVIKVQPYTRTIFSSTNF